MTPEAPRAMDLHLPRAVVDVPGAPTVFNLEPGRALHVERKHLIVGMPPEARRKRHAALFTQIVCLTNVIHRVQLEHEMVQAFWRIRPRD